MYCMISYPYKRDALLTYRNADAGVAQWVEHFLAKEDVRRPKSRLPLPFFLNGNITKKRRGSAKAKSAVRSPLVASR